MGDIATDDETEEGTDAATEDDARRLASFADSLGAGIDAALGPWVEECVRRILVAYEGRTRDEVMAEAADAGRRAHDDVGPEVRALLARDIDDQPTTPLTLVREAVRYPTEVLRRAGVPPVVRDELAERAFPDDDYDLVPATFAELDPSLHEVGIAWGAAKAHVHLARRRTEGLR